MIPFKLAGGAAVKLKAGVGKVVKPRVSTRMMRTSDLPASTYDDFMNQPNLKADMQEILASMGSRGYDPRHPIELTEGYMGIPGAMLGEGNHRLAAARHLGIEEVPVRTTDYSAISKRKPLPDLYGKDRSKDFIQREFKRGGDVLRVNVGRSVPGEQRRQIFQEMNALHKDFPEASRRMSEGVSVYGPGEALSPALSGLKRKTGEPGSGVYHPGRGIEINQPAVIARQAEGGRWVGPKGDSLEHVMRHEFGHAVDYGLGLPDATGAHIGINKGVLKDVVEQRGLVGESYVDVAKNLTGSDYASVNLKEGFAEVFALTRHSPEVPQAEIITKWANRHRDIVEDMARSEAFDELSALSSRQPVVKRNKVPTPDKTMMMKPRHSTARSGVPRRGSGI